MCSMSDEDMREKENELAREFAQMEIKLDVLRIIYNAPSESAAIKMLIKEFETENK